MATNGLFVDYESSESRWKSDSKFSTSPWVNFIEDVARFLKSQWKHTHTVAYIHIYIYKHLHIHCSICTWWIHVCETSMINLGIPNLAAHKVNRRCHLLSLPQLDLFLWNLGRWNIIGFTQIYIYIYVHTSFEPRLRCRCCRCSGQSHSQPFLLSPPHRKKTPLGALSRMGLLQLTALYSGTRLSYPGPFRPPWRIPQSFGSFGWVALVSH